MLFTFLYVRFRVIFRDDILVLFFLNDFGAAISFIYAVALDGIQVCEASALFNF